MRKSTSLPICINTVVRYETLVKVGFGIYVTDRKFPSFGAPRVGYRI